MLYYNMDMIIFLRIYTLMLVMFSRLLDRHSMDDWLLRHYSRRVRDWQYIGHIHGLPLIPGHSSPEA